MKYRMTLKGVIKQTGLKGKPKDICKDRIIGTWKTDNVELYTSDETFCWKT